MSRKKDKNVVQFEASLAFPTHDEIEENLQRRLRLWEDPDRKVRYPLAVLDFLTNAIACELQTGEDAPEFGKDTEFYNPNRYTAGITNGELFYSLYQTIRQMSDDEQFDFSRLPLCDQEAFFSMLDLAITCFSTDAKSLNWRMKASIYGFYMRGLASSTSSLCGTMRKANLFYRPLGNSLTTIGRTLQKM